MESGSSAEGAREDDEVVERDPEGRYNRYRESVGRGLFKQVWKAFDTHIGIDVAWSKISPDISLLSLSPEQLEAVAHDINRGLQLEHPNIIKCFKYWEEMDGTTINLITELFTSGNLRQYRNLHKQLDLKAVKRMARQILQGLNYLHSMDPPVTHGDMRCDKIYVNGHSGEIKIGDLGLATLLPYRWQKSAESEHAHCGATCAQAALQPEGPFDAAADIFAFGLCLLELLTLRQLDPQHCTNYLDLLQQVPDEGSKAFLAKCMAPAAQRPSAVQLLGDPFLMVRRSPSCINVPREAEAGGEAANTPTCSPDAEQREGFEGPSGGVEEKKLTDPIAAGTLRGEDYNFEFHGRVRDGQLHTRLVMTEATPNADDAGAAPLCRTIDFVFDPDEDTADALAAEIADNFSLSPTDTEICAAALKEWLAMEMPDMDGSK